MTVMAVQAPERHSGTSSHSEDHIFPQPVISTRPEHQGTSQDLQSLSRRANPVLFHHSKSRDPLLKIISRPSYTGLSQQLINL